MKQRRPSNLSLTSVLVYLALLAIGLFGLAPFETVQNWWWRLP